VGYVFQNPDHQIFADTVEEEVAFGPRNLGIPGEIGVMEIIMTGFFTALGIHPVLSASATMLIRIVTMWFILFTGGIMIQLVGLKILE